MLLQAASPLHLPLLQPSAPSKALGIPPALGSTGTEEAALAGDNGWEAQLYSSLGNASQSRGWEAGAMLCLSRGLSAACGAWSGCSWAPHPTWDSPEGSQIPLPPLPSSQSGSLAAAERTGQSLPLGAAGGIFLLCSRCPPVGCSPSTWLSWPPPWAPAVLGRGESPHARADPGEAEAPWG